MLDASRLATLTRVQRSSRSLREAADAIPATVGDISAATVSRVENGAGADMETFLLCHWLNVSPGLFFKDSATESEPIDLTAFIRDDETR